MKDYRGIISGILAALSVICGTVLVALGNDGERLFTLAGVCAAYAVGLYSEAR